MFETEAGLELDAAQQAVVAREDVRACGFCVLSAERTLSAGYGASLRYCSSVVSQVCARGRADEKRLESEAATCKV